MTDNEKLIQKIKIELWGRNFVTAMKTVSHTAAALSEATAAWADSFTDLIDTTKKLTNELRQSA